MTKKHFEAAAAMVRAIGGDAPSLRERGLRHDKAWTYIALFEQFNPRFDRERFLRACGVEP